LYEIGKRLNRFGINRFGIEKNGRLALHFNGGTNQRFIGIKPARFDLP